MRTLLQFKTVCIGLISAILQNPVLVKSIKLMSVGCFMSYLDYHEERQKCMLEV